MGEGVLPFVPASAHVVPSICRQEKLEPCLLHLARVFRMGDPLLLQIALECCLPLHVGYTSIFEVRSA